MDRALVQTTAGDQLKPLVQYIDREASGLVLSRGRIRKRQALRGLVEYLRDNGFDAPVVFDTEGYRHHVATSREPFLFDTDRLFPETLEENIAQQRALGVDVAQTPTGYVLPENLDALDVAAELVEQVDRDDFLFTVAVDATILDSSATLARVRRVVDGSSVPVSLVLGSQFDPLDDNTERRIAAVRSLVSGGTPVAAMRTDFNGFDLLGRGAFATAIGTGGSMRHAVSPLARSFTVDPTDESPPVLYERLASWWRGSKIVKTHGRKRAPECECLPCEHQPISRFLAREDAADARAHSLVIWQQWAKLLLGRPTVADRANFWGTFCRGRVDEHALLSAYLGLAKPLAARPALKTWASSPHAR